MKRPPDEPIYFDYDSSQNDNDEDNDWQERQDQDSIHPDKGRRAPQACSAFAPRGAPPACFAFVPEDVYFEVLAAYLKRFLDIAATMQISTHPKDPSRLGFSISMSSSWSRNALQDVREDTAAWELERSDQDFQCCPYDYLESDTFADRKKKGPTEASQPRLLRPRPRRNNHALPDEPIGDHHRLRNNPVQVPTWEIGQQPEMKEREETHYSNPHQDGGPWPPEKISDFLDPWLTSSEARPTIGDNPPLLTRESMQKTRTCIESRPTFGLHLAHGEASLDNMPHCLEA